MGILGDPPGFSTPCSWISQLAGTVPALTQVPSIAAPVSVPGWIAVTDRFKSFHDNILLTPAQRADAATKRAGVVSCLNSRYYGNASGVANCFLVGSWGKDTMVRPPRDVDLYFLLPNDVYQRFEGNTVNRQSALLQEVRRVLGARYWNTTIKGDARIVLVDFGSYAVEVVPSFKTTTPWVYLICDTCNGGRYKGTEPGSEIANVRKVDEACAANLRPLIRMVKTWQAVCSVPIKSFHLELVAADFLQAYAWRGKDWFYFDWMVRDFFAYLWNRTNGSITVPGTGETMALGDAWQSRSLTAWQRAKKACECESINLVEAAGEEWQKIFGSYIPMKP